MQPARTRRTAKGVRGPEWKKANGGPLKEPPTVEEAKVIDETKICINSDCGREFTPLRKDSVVCSKKCSARVSYLKRTGQAKPKRTKKAPGAVASRKNGTGHHAAPLAELPEAAREGVVTIRVSGINLDAFWQKLPIKDKAAMFESWLAGNGGEGNAAN